MNLAGGVWLNEYGFTLRDTGRKVPGVPSWRKRALYEYRADADTPMTFVTNGVYYQPDRHFVTDMGSIPEILQWAFAPKDIHNPSTCMHDCACKMKGLYFSNQLDGEYVFQPISSERAAWLLGQGIYAAGFTRRAEVIYWAVRRFGPQFGV